MESSIVLQLLQWTKSMRNITDINMIIIAISMVLVMLTDDWVTAENIPDEINKTWVNK